MVLDHVRQAVEGIQPHILLIFRHSELHLQPELCEDGSGTPPHKDHTHTHTHTHTLMNYLPWLFPHQDTQHRLKPVLGKYI